MSRTRNILFVLIILFGAYCGVRYLGALLHYSCAEPGADGPPPICLSGELGWLITGGNLVPFWKK